jgi:hypothetical protein
VARSLAAAREHLRALQSGPRWPEAYAALRREAAGLVGAGAAIAASAQPLDGVVIQDGAGRGARNTLAARFQAAEPLLRQLAHEALDGGVRKEEPWSRRTTATPGSAR